MANTRTSTKRARQADKRQERNVKVRSTTRTALKQALDAIRAKDGAQAPQAAKDAYKAAVRALSKAASKGAIPKGRAARKVARLTHFAKKSLPQILG